MGGEYLRGRWLLTVEFDDPTKVQGALEFWQESGRTEMREFVVYLTKRWSLELEEDFISALFIDGNTIQASDDVIDAFSGIQEWLIMHTSPVRVVLERVGPRS
jgi:hypothetical protein